jgi:hypothetical protein
MKFLGFHYYYYFWKLLSYNEKPEFSRKIAALQSPLRGALFRTGLELRDAVPGFF